MKHRFNLWLDIIYPFLCKVVGKRYGCCGSLKNCTRCIRKNGWEDYKADPADKEYLVKEWCKKNCNPGVLCPDTYCIEAWKGVFGADYRKGDN